MCAARISDEDKEFVRRIVGGGKADSAAVADALREYAENAEDYKPLSSWLIEKEYVDRDVASKVLKEQGRRWVECTSCKFPIVVPLDALEVKCPACGSLVIKEVAGDPEGQGKGLPKDEIPDPLIGAQIGDYRIEQRIGKGGMGAIYRAVNVPLGRPVALKVLPKSKAKGSLTNVDRFLSEARSSAALDDPHVVAVYRVGEMPDHYFIEMQLVEGRNLREIVENEGPLPPARAVRIIRDAAKGIAAAHAKNIVHRDVKPDNILVTSDERVKVADFGLARRLDTGEAKKELVGTPHFVAPEVLRGQPCTPASDVYGLGVTLFYMLTGRCPFEGEKIRKVFAKQMNEDPPSVRSVNSSIPAKLADVVDRMIQRDPAQRFSSMDEVLAALNDLLEKPWWRRHVAALIVVLIAFLVIATAALQIGRIPSPRRTESGRGRHVVNEVAGSLPSRSGKPSGTASPKPVSKRMLLVEKVIQDSRPPWDGARISYSPSLVNWELRKEGAEVDLVVHAGPGAVSGSIYELRIPVHVKAGKQYEMSYRYTLKKEGKASEGPESVSIALACGATILGKKIVTVSGRERQSTVQMKAKLTPSADTEELRLVVAPIMPSPLMAIGKQTHRVWAFRLKEMQPVVAQAPAKSRNARPKQSRKSSEKKKKTRRRFLLDEARNVFAKHDYKKTAQMIERALHRNLPDMTRKGFMKLQTELQACVEVRSAIRKALQKKLGKKVTLDCRWKNGKIRYRITGKLEQVTDKTLVLSFSKARSRELEIDTEIEASQQTKLALETLPDTASTWLKLGIYWLNWEEWDAARDAFRTAAAKGADTSEYVARIEK